MVLHQLLLLSRSAKIYAGLLLVFDHMGLFKVTLVPALVGVKRPMRAVIPPPGGLHLAELCSPEGRHQTWVVLVLPICEDCS